MNKIMIPKLLTIGYISKIHFNCDRYNQEFFLKTKKLRGFSPQANYIDRATVACRRS
jgi:hypothetical protein